MIVGLLFTPIDSRIFGRGPNVNTTVKSWYCRAVCCWMCSLDIVKNDATPTACNVGSALEPCPHSGLPMIANHTKVLRSSTPKKSCDAVMVVGLVCRNVKVAGASGLDFETSGTASYYGMWK